MSAPSHRLSHVAAIGMSVRAECPAMPLRADNPNSAPTAIAAFFAVTPDLLTID
jgi:hypothetical protein